MALPEALVLFGLRFPYDQKEGEIYPPVEEWERKAALGILAELCERRGLSHELGAVDDDVRREIVDSITEIIKYSWERWGKEQAKKEILQEDTTNHGEAGLA